MKNRLRLAPRPPEPDLAVNIIENGDSRQKQSLQAVSGNRNAERIEVQNNASGAAFDVFDFEEFDMPQADELRRCAAQRPCKLKVTSFVRGAFVQLAARPALSGLFSLSVEFDKASEADFQAAVKVVLNAPALELLRFSGARLLRQNVCDQFVNALSGCPRLHDVFLTRFDGFQDALLGALLRLPLRELRFTSSGLSCSSLERFRVRGRPPLRCQLIDLSDNPLGVAAFALAHAFEQSQVAVSGRVSVIMSNCQLGSVFASCLFDVFGRCGVAFDVLDFSSNFLTADAVTDLCALARKVSVRVLKLHGNKLDATALCLVQEKLFEFVDLSQNVIVADAERVRGIQTECDLSSNLLVGACDNQLVTQSKQFADFEFPVVRGAWRERSAAVAALSAKIASQNLVFRQAEALRLMLEAARAQPFSYQFKRQIAALADFPGILTSSLAVDPHTQPDELDALFSAYAPLLPNLRMLDLSAELSGRGATALVKICCHACRAGLFEVFDLSGVSDGVMLQNLLKSAADYAVYCRMPAGVSAFRVFYNLRMRGVQFQRLRYLDCECVENAQEVELLMQEMRQSCPACQISTNALLPPSAAAIQPDKRILRGLLEDEWDFGFSRVKNTVARVGIFLKETLKSPVEYNDSTLQLSQLFPAYLADIAYVSLFDNEQQRAAARHSTFKQLHLIFSENGSATAESGQKAQNDNVQTSLAPQVDLQVDLQHAESAHKACEPNESSQLRLQQLEEPSNDEISSGSVVRDEQKDQPVEDIKVQQQNEADSTSQLLQSASDYRPLKSSIGETSQRISANDEAAEQHATTASFGPRVSFADDLTQSLRQTEQLAHSGDFGRKSLNQSIKAIQSQITQKQELQMQDTLMISLEQTNEDVITKKMRVKALLPDAAAPSTQNSVFHSFSQQEGNQDVKHVAEHQICDSDRNTKAVSTVKCKSQAWTPSDVAATRQLLAEYSELKEQQCTLDAKMCKLYDMREQQMQISLKRLFLDLKAMKSNIARQFACQSRFGLELLFHPIFVQQPRFEAAWALLQQNVHLIGQESADYSAVVDILENANCLLILRNLERLQSVELATDRPIECFGTRVVQLLVLSELRGVELGLLDSFAEADALFQRLQIQNTEKWVQQMAACQKSFTVLKQYCADAVSQYKKVASHVAIARQSSECLRSIGAKLRSAENAASTARTELDVTAFQAAQKNAATLRLQLEETQREYDKAHSQYVYEVSLFAGLQKRNKQFAREDVEREITAICGAEAAAKVIQKIFQY